jgi:phosphoenolpyruvate carboxylase
MSAAGQRARSARAAEPGGIGSARARDPLALEIRLLGSLLGQVITEQAGEGIYDLVERLRLAAIDFRRSDQPEERERLEAELDALELRDAEAVITAFSLYFQLVNLAEARARVRALRRRERAARDGLLDDSVAEAVARLRRRDRSDADLDAMFARLRITPVLTAHPTEARRRTTLVALRRCAVLLEGLDDTRLTPSEDREIRRRLREEITVLWRTSDLRAVKPEPLDEVRTAMAVFDATLFQLAPRLYRAVDATLDAGSGARAPRTPAFLRFGSWIGGDRDGNPVVTSDLTGHTLRIQADHVLHGYEAVALRLMQTESATTAHDRVAKPLATRLARDADALDVELREIQDALEIDGMGRVAWGEVADMRWQLATFGFHLASLEVRQHSAVHRATEAALFDRAPGREVAPGVTAAEVVDTIRAVTAAQDRYGPGAAGRYVISFTAEAEDVVRLLRLTWSALPADPLADRGAARRPDAGCDIVPLFEDAATLMAAGRILDDILRAPAYRDHLRGRGDRQEVMLGYSDSNKESGYLAANWLLHRAQAALAASARTHDVELTLFHGRGGAIGRGGGPANRAILGLAAGSLEGRLKLTEQGEVIAANYADAGIARRHLERLAAATLVASSAAHAASMASVEAAGRAVLDELAEASRDAYRRLVEAPGFVAFFRLATPIAEISTLRLGSRPAARGRTRTAPMASGEDPAARQADSIADLRAIPWVFAWSQARIELPGWYGLGAALEAHANAHGATAIEGLARLYRRWPFLASLIDNAELALARADLGVARQYAALAGDAATGPWAAIEAEYARTVAWVGRLTGRERLLEREPELRRRMGLRDPYVDSLSETQVTLLARLRACEPDDPERERLLRLVQLTVNGIAAGLQRTG